MERRAQRPLPPRRRGPFAVFWAGANSASPKGLVSGRLGTSWRRSSSSGGTGSDGPFFPVFCALMSCHRTRRAMDSRVVNRLNGQDGRGRMERTSGLRDLSEDRKAGDRSGFEARRPLRQIDRILDGLRDDEVGIARPVAPRERDDEVRDRPSLLGREAVGERRHRRAVEPRGHRPEDILAGRPSPEGPALREVGCAYRLPQFVRQRWSRRSVAPTEVTVALQAAGLRVKLLSELD